VSGCDYFLVSTVQGFALLEWYGGYDPDIGDEIVGKVRFLDRSCSETGAGGVEMKKIVLVLVLAAMTMGCMSFAGHSMDSWMGKTEQELVWKAGPPMSRTSDGNGGSVLVYQNIRNFNVLNQPIPSTYPGPYAATRLFYVNRDGVIYAWRA
jgi:hypothetical protein